MIAYNLPQLFNLSATKEAKRWKAQDVITKEQLDRIREQHPVSFYHPNLFIRILLFLATFISMGGLTGLIVLSFEDLLNEQSTAAALMILYGALSWVILERVFIRKNHYKSGVNEAILYHSLLWLILGFSAAVDFNGATTTIVCLLLTTIAAIRYADLISTTAALASLVWLIFHELESAGGVAATIIPFVFIAVFTPMYFATRYFRRSAATEPWDDCLILVEVLCLLLVYASGNYFVIRELSESMMQLYVEPGSDIPFAVLFYALTVVIPALYLYAGLKNKDIVLIRVSLLALAFSVFTFKYYFSLGHPEITLTIAGAVLLAITLLLYRYLRTPRNGYTREKLLSEQWAESNPEAILISQTLGGNRINSEGLDTGNGGSFGGGGSADTY